ncbi:phosphate ABC transporter substrate-binding protein PstS [Amorphoplanes nipponensis]|uniref:Phosphate-binding protein n=1 Tax=Actinoplanes nipponensis TaxID=135950 RepID=A0A919JDZ0_9ACTN|nr:phosphate ABC transporter substrate-binding protein PstS [Actinoplanes nipponensis]GIE48958.1 phosphate-binding protein PstS [Actinoplanes nipponensis]
MSGRLRLAAGPAVALVLALAACAPAAAPRAVAEAVPCVAGSLRGQGSSAQTNAVNTWIRNYQIACSGATVAYGSTGSGAGVRAFLAGSGDFAGTDSPLTAPEQAAADARCGRGPAVHLPMVIAPIALAYTVAGVDDLRLAPATVARIFAGAVTSWDDPLIAADNPGVPLPATAVRTVHRSDSSGTTANFTGFLAATAGAGWRFGTDSTWAAPGGSAARGSNGVASAIARTDGAIGYVEASYARFHQLAVARVRNGAGEFAAVTDEAAGRTVAAAGVTGAGGDLRLAVDHRTAVLGAYPIVLVTYEVVCRTGTPARTRPLLRGFLTYTAGPAGQAAAARLGYAPLPEQLRRKVAAVVAGLD